ncbi:Oidioi.mRNA.OKI2018_I69.XSR.g14853.t1.cds [Oikopleura dioica]|uniref:Oidioi.mRNA.OKI2018_I69.XSR.g14853.t1.cds n=1 Tax=Oikopleura dioica TaxID=34765 RepID=A0ABN7SBI1_OIKDI|nr:Oidioi.mRNA.OKI2018_I69.XSR.g14853.t1.cds [Oikopleura dioica]
MEVKEEPTEIIEDPSTTAVKMEMDSEEDSEPEFHVSNKNPEKLLEESDDEASIPPKSIASELGIRSKTIFQECKDTVRLAGKAAVNLAIELEMARDDHVIKNHYDFNSPASYNGILTKENAAGRNHCTENHFFKSLPKWVIKQLQQPNLLPVIYKFNGPSDLSLAKGNPFGSIAVAFLISQIGLYDVIGPKAFVSGFNQLYRTMFTKPPGAPEETLPPEHPVRRFDCLSLDENEKVEFLENESRCALYKSQCFTFVSALSSDSD